MNLRSALFLCALTAIAACSGTPSTPKPDVEALQLANHNTPLAHLHTSGQPTQAQFDQLAAAGVTRVIQLRPANEQGTGWEEERAAALGMTFVRLPVAGNDGLTQDNVRRLADELGKQHDGDTLLCCGSSNRVGALLALRAFWLEGKSIEESLILGKAGGMTRLEPKVKELMAAPK